MEKKNFQLSCESTVDLPYDYITGRGFSVLFYEYSVEGETYVDDMGRDPEALSRFYGMLDDGKLPTTSQINQFRYEEYFERLIQDGDVLHLAFGSGMTPSVRNAYAAAEVLKEKYPDRTITVIDSLCSSVGYGLLADTVADLRDAGKTVAEITEWVLQNRGKVRHQFFSTDLTMFRRSGRVSGLSAIFGTVLGICPIMHLNNEGRIVAYAKARGKNGAIETTLREIMAHIRDGEAYDGKVYIGHSNCMPLAQEVAARLKQQIPHVKQIEIVNIGTIIASHCGPGTVAIFFYGDERGE